MPTQVEITYTFDASQEVVFKAFTEAQHLQNYWGAKGWAFHVLKADFRPGGVFHYSQKPDDGDNMWVKFEYSELVASEKIVYTSFFSNDEGYVVRAPFDAHWPLKTLNTMTFIEQEGKTILTTVITPVSPTEEENNTFSSSREVVKNGFTGTYDQLAEYLKGITINVVNDNKPS